MGQTEEAAGIWGLGSVVEHEFLGAGQIGVLRGCGCGVSSLDRSGINRQAGRKRNLGLGSERLRPGCQEELRGPESWRTGLGSEGQRP